jgi:hypothetical protein
MALIAFQRNDVITGRTPAIQMHFSPAALGGAGLASGIFSLVAVRLGFGSWMVLGTAFVVWCLSGWALLFAEKRGSGTLRILGYIFLATGLLTAAAIIAKAYLVALGPAWIL